MIREFRLSPGGKGQGVSCGENGAFFGSIPLLKRSSVNGNDYWQPIDSEQLSEDIGKQFDLPIDMSRKKGGLKTIADALNAGDVARAQIAAVLLGIPNPPRLFKNASARDDMIKFIRDLHWSGMIKTDWNPDEHPRWPAGAPDSQGGQFAPKGSGESESNSSGDTLTGSSGDKSHKYPRDAALDDGVYRPNSDPAELEPAASTPQQLKQNLQQHEDEVNRQVRWLENKGKGSIKVTKNVHFIGRNGVPVVVDYVVSVPLPDGFAGFWLEPVYGADVKTGKGPLTGNQYQVYPKIGARSWVRPVGENAIAAGFEPDEWVWFPIVYGDALSTTEH